MNIAVQEDEEKHFEFSLTMIILQKAPLEEKEEVVAKKAGKTVKVRFDL